MYMAGLYTNWTRFKLGKVYIITSSNIIPDFKQFIVVLGLGSHTLSLVH